ncbi:MAG: carboxymuconolactone decarboxylase family protein [Pseudonocardiaceae bacterium]
MVKSGSAVEPWYRNKSPAKIAQSALIQVTRRKDSGCASCVDAYIEIARKNGATELEINSALGLAERTTVAEDGRRDD